MSMIILWVFDCKDRNDLYHCKMGSTPADLVPA